MLLGGDLFTRYALPRLSKSGVMAKAGLIMEAYKKAGACCMVPGERDMFLGLQGLKELAGQGHVDLLAANIVKKEDKKPVFKPFVVKRVGRFKVGILGLVGTKAGYKDDVLNAAGLEISDPVQAAKDAMARLKAKGVDLVLVLSHLGHGEDDAVAQAVPELSLFVGGHQSRRGTREIQRKGLPSAWVVDSGVRGQYLGRLDLFTDSKGRLENITDGGVGERLKKEIQRQEKSISMQKARLRDLGDIDKQVEQEKRRRKARLDSLELRIENLEKQLASGKTKEGPALETKKTRLKRYKEQLETLKKAALPTKEELRKRAERRKKSIELSIKRSEKLLQQKKDKLAKLADLKRSGAYFVFTPIPMDDSAREDKELAKQVKELESSDLLKAKADQAGPPKVKAVPLIKPLNPAKLPSRLQNVKKPQLAPHK